MPIVDVDKLKQGGQKFASGFTAGQKVMSVLGVIGLGLALVMFTKWSATTDYAPLYTDLSAKDAGEVTKALDAANVPYKLTNGGTSIEVPRDQVYKARVDLSAKGLPTKNDGYSIIDNGGITQSKFQQDVNYQRAVQTELANTIMAINGVHDATVNLALPSDDPFVGDDQKKATAAVQVDTGNVQLQNDQVQSIVHLVASSVKNLAPNAITLTDTNGTLLYSADSTGSMSSAQNLSRKMQYENSIRTNVERLISQSLGPGHAAVTVNLDMDFAKGSTVIDREQPTLDANGKPIPGATQTKTTKLTETGGNNNGVLGNPATGTGGTGTSTKNFDERDQTVTNPLTKTHEETEKNPDAIKLMSISVALDKNVVQPTDLAAWRQQIAAAAGVQTTRNDVLVVNAMPMDPKVQAAAQKRFEATTNPGKTAATPLDIMGIARYALTFLIVALVLFLAWRSVKKAQNNMQVRTPIDLNQLEAADAQQYAMELAASVGHNGELPSAAPKAIESSRSTIELEVADLIERQPDEVAQTLRSWLADRRS